MFCLFFQKGAMSPMEVCEGLGLYDLKNRKWHIQGTCALRGDGLYEGLDWLASTLKEHKAAGFSSVGTSSFWLSRSNFITQVLLLLRKHQISNLDWIFFLCFWYFHGLFGNRDDSWWVKLKAAVCSLEIRKISQPKPFLSPSCNSEAVG